LPVHGRLGALRARAQYRILTAARVLQGFGGGGLMTLSQALVGETIPPRERGRYQGYLAGVSVSSSTFGPVAGGYLTQAFGWRSIFLVNVPLGLHRGLLVLRLRRKPAIGAGPRSMRRAWSCSHVREPVILALEQAQRMDARTLPMGLGLMLSGSAALLALIWQEKHSSSPLIPPLCSESLRSGAATAWRPATARRWFR
jgi:MFS family permease